MNHNSQFSILNSQLQNRKTILLVEDNKKVQKFNKRMMERNGFTIETAFTLAEAKDILTRQTPAAIILDVGMPDGNGLDFLREIRSGQIKQKDFDTRENSELCIVNYELSKVPVLLLTGYRVDPGFVKNFTAGRDDYLAKPYEFEVLLGRIKRLLDEE